MLDCSRRGDFSCKVLSARFSTATWMLQVHEMV